MQCYHLYTEHCSCHAVLYSGGLKHVVDRRLLKNALFLCGNFIQVPLFVVSLIMDCRCYYVQNISTAFQLSLYVSLSQVS